MNLEEFIKSRRGERFKDKLHLSLLPVPFTGDLHKADIFILLLNPGFSLPDYGVEANSHEYRQRLLASIRQEFDGAHCPFIGLDPDVCWHPGFGWWERRLNAVITRIAKERYNGNYLKTLRELGDRLAAIELVPYHSQNFEGKDRLINQLPSVQVAKHFLHARLLPMASTGEKKSKKTIIVLRGAKRWEMAQVQESEYICVYKGLEAQGANLNPDSRGGRAILRQFNIT